MVARRETKAAAFRKPLLKAEERATTKQARTVRRVLLNLVNEVVLSRSTLAAQRADDIDPPGRDLNKECGYPESPGTVTFRSLYDRWGFARRVNDVMPDECFAVYPQVYETEKKKNTRFEVAWNDLNKRIPSIHYLHRVDRASGIAGYGALLFGFNDGPLDRPVAGLDPKTGEPLKKRPKKPLKLMYLRPFSGDHCRIAEIDNDDTSPRCGQPVYYELTLSNPEGALLSGTTTKRVHWTRILHVCDNRESSDVVGAPRMKAVLNYLLDLRKTGGGSAEMFWKGAFPGYSFETIPDLLGESIMDEETIRDQFEEYMEGLKRYLALDGVTAKPLLPQTADPTAHANLQIQLVAATIGVPVRVLMGTEAAHLASTQDLGTWNKRVAQRQLLYLEPMLLRPFIDRLIAVGILPAPAEGDYIIQWKDLNTMSDKDKAAVALQRSQALMQYVTGGCEAVMPVREYLTLILGLTEAESTAVIEAVAKNKPLTDPLGVEQSERDAKIQIKTAKAAASARPTRDGGSPQGGGRRGRPPRAKTGRPAGEVPSTAA